MSGSSDFCSAEDISVVIPYKTLEKLLKSATNGEAQAKQIKRLEDQVGALHGLYSQLLEVVADIRANL